MINVDGDFLFAQNNEVNFNTDTAIFQFADATESTLEVAGENLRIKAGSKLIIGYIDVYAFIDAEMDRVNDRLGLNTKYISYDEGTIALTDFDCSLKADLNGDCFVDLGDFATLASEWLESGVN